MGTRSVKKTLENLEERYGELLGRFRETESLVRDLQWQMSGFNKKVPLFDQIKLICKHLNIEIVNSPRIELHKEL